jgi:hypothetical protein
LRLLLLRRGLRPAALARRAARACAAERQFGQQRHARARHLQIPRGQRAVGLGLLQQQPRIRELELRGHAGAIADVRDLVGARWPAAPCRRWLPTPRVPRSARPTPSGVERRQLLHLLFLQPRRVDVGARQHLVALLAPPVRIGTLIETPSDQLARSKTGATLSDRRCGCSST